MKKIIQVIVFGLALSLNYSPVLANTDLQEKIDRILQNTMAAGQPLTPQVHAEFWALAHSMGTPQEIDELVQGLIASLLNFQEYQKELWESAALSYREKKVVKSQRLLELEELLPNDFRSTLPYKKDSKNYRDAIKAYEDRKRISDENARRLLKAAAEHKPLNSVQGQVIEINEQQIQHVLTNLQNSFNNLSNLLDENWEP